MQCKTVWQAGNAGCMPLQSPALRSYQMVQLPQCVKAACVLGEHHTMGLQQRDGDLPRVVGLAKEADDLGGDLGLRLADRYAVKQCLREKGGTRVKEC